jgi:hypothetical protein
MRESMPPPSNPKLTQENIQLLTGAVDVSSFVAGVITRKPPDLPTAIMRFAGVLSFASVLNGVSSVGCVEDKITSFLALRPLGLEEAILTAKLNARSYMVQLLAAEAIKQNFLYIDTIWSKVESFNKSILGRYEPKKENVIEGTQKFIDTMLTGEAKKTHTERLTALKEAIAKNKLVDEALKNTLAEIDADAKKAAQKGGGVAKL